MSKLMALIVFRPFLHFHKMAAAAPAITTLLEAKREREKERKEKRECHCQTHLFPVAEKAKVF